MEGQRRLRAERGKDEIDRAQGSDHVHARRHHAEGGIGGEDRVVGLVAEAPDALPLHAGADLQPLEGP